MALDAIFRWHDVGFWDYVSTQKTPTQPVPFPTSVFCGELKAVKKHATVKAEIRNSKRPRDIHQLGQPLRRDIRPAALLFIIAEKRLNSEQVYNAGLFHSAHKYLAVKLLINGIFVTLRRIYDPAKRQSF